MVNKGRIGVIGFIGLRLNRGIDQAQRLQHQGYDMGSTGYLLMLLMVSGQQQ
jgi:hypothetical protein